MNAYEDRDAVLKSLGYSSYRAYLRSELWKLIRAAVLSRNPKCVCGRKSRHAHHKRYDVSTMEGRDLTHLIGLCAGCHQMIEFDGDGDKATLDRANEKLKRKTDVAALIASRRAKRIKDSRKKK